MIRFISIIVLIISTTAVFCQNEKTADAAFDNGKAVLSGGGRDFKQAILFFQKQLKIIQNINKPTLREQVLFQGWEILIWQLRISQKQFH